MLPRNLEEARPAQDATVRDLLARDPAAVERITGWIRDIAEHRAWGFESSDDLVQETLLAVIRNLQAGRFAGGNLQHYVRRIAKNICVSSYRRSRVRGRELPLEEAPPLSASGNESVRMEGRLMVQHILDKLDERCRRLIRLAYYEGLARREIAERLGISESAAKVRLHRCIERARELGRA